MTIIRRREFQRGEGGLKMARNVPTDVIFGLLAFVRHGISSFLKFRNVRGSVEGAGETATDFSQQFRKFARTLGARERRRAFSQRRFFQA
jgi:hypothetical protein